MKTKILPSLGLACALAFASEATRAVPALFDFGINIDGATACLSSGCDTSGLADLSGVPGVSDGGFDYVTGIGTITVTLSGAGAHAIDLFLDHEIDEPTTTFFNEFGDTSGAPSAGQSWEIDEPGFVFGDIFDNFLASTLDDSNAVPSGLDDDVSMALGFDFALGAGDTAIIDFIVDTIAPGGFFLSHTDADTSETIYFTGALAIVSGPPTPAPEPLSLFLMGLGLSGVGFTTARRRRES